MKHAIAIALGLAMTACSAADEVAEEIAMPSASAQEAAEASPSSADGAGVSVENDTMTFKYSWPAKAASIPPLAKHMTKRAERDRASFERDAIAAKADAEEYGYPYRPYERQTEWKVVADTPGYLSLSAENWFYTGGAHGNSSNDALVWDREAGKAVEPANMFASPFSLSEAIRSDYCPRFQASRAQRIGAENMPEGDDDIFSACPAIEELTVLVGSSDRTKFNRIGLIADPYVVGSFAEGPYEVTVPVTEEVMGAVKPEYRDAFAPAK